MGTAGTWALNLCVLSRHYPPLLQHSCLVRREPGLTASTLPSAKPQRAAYVGRETAAVPPGDSCLVHRHPLFQGDQQVQVGHALALSSSLFCKSTGSLIRANSLWKQREHVQICQVLKIKQYYLMNSEDVYLVPLNRLQQFTVCSAYHKSSSFFKKKAFKDTNVFVGMYGA